MGLYASWVHGTAFQPPEFPAQGLQPIDGIHYTDVVGLRRGWGSFWRGRAGSANWFHVSIPTPVVIDGHRVKLERIFVMFTAGKGTPNNANLAGANVTDIHVWDGPNRIKTFGPFMLFGDHRFKLPDTSNTHVLSPQLDISWGVGISVRVAFSADELVGFASAGADFYT
jgi:hypothetical protein